jgi:hypothetical protein
MYKGLHVKYPFFLSDLHETLIFSIDFREILKYEVSHMQIRPEGAELFHGNGWRDTTKLAAAFRNFPNGPKNGKKNTRTISFRSLLPWQLYSALQKQIQF